MGVTWWNLQSQLLVAIQNDDEARAKELLAAGVDCDARFNFGAVRRPAVCLCVERGSLGLVRLLIDNGCSINQSDTKGQTALHLAAGRSQVQLLELLLRHRANVSTVDEQERTALHWASQRDQPRAAQLLLEHGAAVERKDEDGRTPLLVACLHHCAATGRLLLQHGAAAHHVDQQGNTALHYAVSAGASDADLVDALLRAGAPVNRLNASGLSALHVAVNRGIGQRHRQRAIHLLAAAGANLDATTPLGQTALHMAVLERDVESALALLRLSARVDTIDANGMPPLFHAARDGNRRLVRALLAAGAGVLPKGVATSLLQRITDPQVQRLVTRAATYCPKLSCLARHAFRSFATRHSVQVAAELNLPHSLVRFIDYSDVDDLHDDQELRHGL